MYQFNQISQQFSSVPFCSKSVDNLVLDNSARYFLLKTLNPIFYIPAVCHSAETILQGVIFY